MFIRRDGRLLDDFDNYLERVGRAPATRELYVRAGRELLEETGKSFVALTPADVDAHLAQWRDAFARAHGRPPASATYKNRVTALRALYRWMDRFDLSILALRFADSLAASFPTASSSGGRSSSPSISVARAFMSLGE
jgi:hypothetical protein